MTVEELFEIVRLHLPDAAMEATDYDGEYVIYTGVHDTDD